MLMRMLIRLFSGLNTLIYAVNFCEDCTLAYPPWKGKTGYLVYDLTNFITPPLPFEVKIR